MTIERRTLLIGSLAVGAAGGIAMTSVGKSSESTDSDFECQLSDAEWRSRLTPEQYRVLREHGTESAGSSVLNAEKRSGIYYCVACGQALFESKAKYDSGTGWPSFWKPIQGAVGYRTDRSWWIIRTEVHCRCCGGHLGHVFDDGPPPTGKRYCINGVALRFEPAPS